MSANSWAVEIAARTLCQEARGEPPEGQSAVAHVLKNRLVSGRWGASLASVCLWPMQFSGWRGPRDPNFAYACSLADDDAMLSKMRDVIAKALARPDDPTQGPTHYYADTIGAPGWTEGAVCCGKFGHQLFYRNVK